MKRMLLGLTFLLLLGSHANAEVPWDPGWGCSADGSGCPDGTVIGDGGNDGGGRKPDEYTLGGDFANCQAWSIWNQHCYGCSPNRYGKIECAPVTWSAGCKCEQKRVNPSTYGITECHSYYQCTYDAT